MASIFKKIAKSIGGAISGATFGDWVGLGSAVIGGLSGGKSKKQPAPGVDYQRLRDEAAAAGFNPLTALYAGGSQAYQYTYGPSISRVGSVAAAISDFTRGQYERQIEQDRLALERDYFGLEQQRLKNDSTRLGLERTSLDYQALGAQYGPVFGPQARTQDPKEPLYAAMSEEYGPGPAWWGGWAKALGDAGSWVIRTNKQASAAAYNYIAPTIGELWRKANQPDRQGLLPTFFPSRPPMYRKN